MAFALADRLVNLVSGLGTAKDKNTYATYCVPELTQPQALNAYRSDWIARKVVDIPAFDMIREGRNWQADDEQIEKLEAEEARLQVWPKLAKALKLARLYGGSALILGTGDSDPSQPLNVNAVRAGGLAYIHVASRYEITAGQVDRDAASPRWGEPLDYTMNSTGRALKLHPSRVIPFIGSDVPDLAYTHGWGDSILQVLDEAIKNAGLAAGGIAQLLQEAKIDVFKIPDFMANVGDEAYRNKVLQRVGLANQGKSLTNALLMDSNEDYQQKTVTFSDLPEILSLYLQIAAGAADIPATRLLGQAPAGMNATGESDLRNYYDRLASEQEVMLRPRLERLDEVLIPSALGSRPPEVHFAFAPLWQLSEKERSDIRKQDADTAKVYVDSGLVPTVALAKAVQNQLVEAGSYPGLETALKDTKATVGLGPELLKTLLTTWQAGGMPLEDLYTRMKAAGMTSFASFEAFQQAIEDEGPALGTIEDPEEGVVDPDAPPALPDPNADPAVTGDAAPRTLYVRRDVLNHAEIEAWAKSQGFKTTLASDMHVTVLYSKRPVDWLKMGENWSGDGKGNLTIQPGGPRLVEPLGSEGAIVLLFSATDLQWRHRNMIEAGASSDYSEFTPHVTIAYDLGDVDLKTIEPYRGAIILGPEIFEEIKGWSPN